MSPRPSVRLVEACSKIIVKLSLNVVFGSKYHPFSLSLILVRGLLTLTPPPRADHDCKAFERSFDFSEFPRLREVNSSHAVCHMGRGIPWIPTALSTLSPTTSPHLSSLGLLFFGSSSQLRPEFSIEDVGNDLQRVADQITRIERESEGAANFTVVLDPIFWVACNIRCSM